MPQLRCAILARLPVATSQRMAIDFYLWIGRTPVLASRAVALECKGLQYNSHLLHFAARTQVPRRCSAMNFPRRLPVLRDGDYVVSNLWRSLLPRP